MNKLSLLIICIIMFYTYNRGYDARKRLVVVEDTHKEILLKIDSIQVHLDALTKHFEQCSFINKDDVAINHQGYFYSKYYKNNVK